MLAVKCESLINDMVVSSLQLVTLDSPRLLNVGYKAEWSNSLLELTFNHTCLLTESYNESDSYTHLVSYIPSESMRS